jgi:hypothetical protein
MGLILLFGMSGRFSGTRTSVGLAERVRAFSGAGSSPSPNVRIHGQSSHLSGHGIEKAAVMAQFSISEQSGQRGESTGCQSLINERFLPFKRLLGGTTRKGIFSRGGVCDLGIEFTNRTESTGFAHIAAVQRLTKDILTARCVIAEIQPITHPA